MLSNSTKYIAVEQKKIDLPLFHQKIQLGAFKTKFKKDFNDSREEFQMTKLNDHKTRYLGDADDFGKWPNNAVQTFNSSATTPIEAFDFSLKPSEVRKLRCADKLPNLKIAQTNLELNLIKDEEEKRHQINMQYMKRRMKGKRETQNVQQFSVKSDFSLLNDIL